MVSFLIHQLWSGSRRWNVSLYRSKTVWHGQYHDFFMTWWHNVLQIISSQGFAQGHGNVIKWKHFPRYWVFVRGNPPVNIDSPYKGQWCGTLMFSLICTWTNGWTNNWDAEILRHHRIHYDVPVMNIAAAAQEALRDHQLTLDRRCDRKHTKTHLRTRALLWY